MERGNEEGEIEIDEEIEKGIIDNRGKIMMIGEFEDRLEKIDIGVRVKCNNIEDERNGKERKLVIKIVEKRKLKLWKLKEKEKKERIEKEIRIDKRIVDMRKIENEEGDSIGIENIVIERKLIRIGIEELKIVDEEIIDGELKKEEENRKVDIENGEMWMEERRLKDEKGNVESEEWKIKRGKEGEIRGRKKGKNRIFKEEVNKGRNKIVNDVVKIGKIMEKVVEKKMILVLVKRIEEEWMINEERWKKKILWEKEVKIEVLMDNR